MRRLRAFLGSMAGRIFLVLLAGLLASTTAALTLAYIKRNAELQRIGLERAAERTATFVEYIEATPPELRRQLLAQGVPGVRPAPPDLSAEGFDTELQRLLAQRLPTLKRVSAGQADPRLCILPHNSTYPAIYFDVQCWLVTFRLRDGTPMRLTVVRTNDEPRPVGLDPLILLILLAGVAAMAFPLSRMTAAPLHRLSRAAEALGEDLDRSPLPETGPLEVRNAAAALNLMQSRLRHTMLERRSMLAAITHDLQTPLTRLRLRLEQVPDAALRERLVADLSATLHLIDEGLELARSADVREPVATFDLDSLLHSLADDASDAGQNVRFLTECFCDVEGRPQALHRCVANLVDNALKYAGDAVIDTTLSKRGVSISIRDHGPGVPTEKLDAILDPFVRLEASRSRTTGGVGLGLTIAKILAEQSYGRLSVHNHPQGGLQVVIFIDAHHVKRRREVR